MALRQICVVGTPKPKTRTNYEVLCQILTTNPIWTQSVGDSKIYVSMCEATQLHGNESAHLDQRNGAEIC